MAGITDILKQQVEQYAGLSLNAKLYPVFDEIRHVYTVISVGENPEKQPVRAVVMARLTGDRIVIEADTTDKPLVDALVLGGISRDHIVLAYAGEESPETA